MPNLCPALTTFLLLHPHGVIAILAEGSPKLLEVKPARLARLLNSVYGSDQILLFQRDDEPAKVLPALLSFDQSSAVEAESSEQAGAWFASFDMVGKMVARTEFFETVAGGKLSIIDLAQKAGASSSLSSIMLMHLDECGLVPVTCVLGSIQEGEVSSVRMVDMGANTPAAPLAVKLTSQLPATLYCKERSGGDEELPELPVPLGGAADAMLLSRAIDRKGEMLPILVTRSTWESRAVTADRLPETTNVVTYLEEGEFISKN
ncbi:MAG: hypothetical protein SGPRY_013709 [Prymnesium sp.]